MTTVTKIFEFESCHHLPYYDGDCKRLHGHSYKLEVTVGGFPSPVSPANPKSGMIIDFKVLKEIVNCTVIEKCDHQNLNNVYDYPTAEMMASQMAFDIMGMLPQNVYLVSIKLWETSSSYAEYRPGIPDIPVKFLQSPSDVAKSMGTHEGYSITTSTHEE